MKNIFLLFLGFLSIQLSYAEVDALKLLKVSDLARGGLESGLEWNVTIKNTEGNETSLREFQIKAKGVDSIAVAISPERNKGEVFLFNDRTMWFFKPSLKKPISISAKQRLTGQAANGDIATTNYARDYNASFEKEEKINNDNTNVLMLKAKEKNTTYDQIRYWISIKSGLAVKADFLTLQGKLFKSATFEYDNKISYNGLSLDFISKMTIVDSNNNSNESILIYQQPKVGKFSDVIFNVNGLKR